VLKPEFATAKQNPFRGAGAGPASNVRYVPAEGVAGKFIDMQHFLAAAAKAYDLKQEVGPKAAAALVIAGGVAVETDQAVRGMRTDNTGLKASAFSYEDIPSNNFGAQFGAFSYDPSKPLPPQIEQFLKGIGGMSPAEFCKKNVTICNQLPSTEQKAVQEYGTR
jgi:hypothetical protein